ncbi:hypothetical protein PAPYR_11218 [Paratrimastix pyriformis]|uniref:Sfi1 spindle body domain-containing protein n=1 Tax=Paratrimastix pyriformis TaxID=342808 RepID=A0ABQ8U466_9EUKA|nr:hypothetical protein PAPYR_11218 [Paratrimastix pyriformis]
MELKIVWTGDPGPEKVTSIPFDPYRLISVSGFHRYTALLNSAPHQPRSKTPAPIQKHDLAAAARTTVKLGQVSRPATTRLSQPVSASYLARHHSKNSPPVVTMRDSPPPEHSPIAFLPSSGGADHVRSHQPSGPQPLCQQPESSPLCRHHDATTSPAHSPPNAPLPCARYSGRPPRPKPPTFPAPPEKSSSPLVSGWLDSTSSSPISPLDTPPRCTAEPATPTDDSSLSIEISPMPGPPPRPLSTAVSSPAQMAASLEVRSPPGDRVQVQTPSMPLAQLPLPDPGPDRQPAGILAALAHSPLAPPRSPSPTAPIPRALSPTAPIPRSPSPKASPRSCSPRTPAPQSPARTDPLPRAARSPSPTASLPSPHSPPGSFLPPGSPSSPRALATRSPSQAVPVPRSPSPTAPVPRIPSSTAPVPRIPSSTAPVPRIQSPTAPPSVSSAPCPGTIPSPHAPQHAARPSPPPKRPSPPPHPTSPRQRSGRHPSSPLAPSSEGPPRLSALGSVLRAADCAVAHAMQAATDCALRSPQRLAAAAPTSPSPSLRPAGSPVGARFVPPRAGGSSGGVARTLPSSGRSPSCPGQPWPSPVAAVSPMGTDSTQLSLSISPGSSSYLPSPPPLPVPGPQFSPGSPSRAWSPLIVLPPVAASPLGLVPFPAMFTPEPPTADTLTTPNPCPPPTRSDPCPHAGPPVEHGRCSPLQPSPARPVVLQFSPVAPSAASPTTPPAARLPPDFGHPPALLPSSLSVVPSHCSAAQPVAVVAPPRVAIRRFNSALAEVTKILNSVAIFAPPELLAPQPASAQLSSPPRPLPEDRTGCPTPPVASGLPRDDPEATGATLAMVDSLLATHPFLTGGQPARAGPVALPGEGARGGAELCALRTRFARNREQLALHVAWLHWRAFTEQRGRLVRFLGMRQNRRLGACFRAWQRLYATRASPPHPQTPPHTPTGPASPISAVLTPPPTRETALEGPLPGQRPGLLRRHFAAWRRHVARQHVLLIRLGPAPTTQPQPCLMNTPARQALATLTGSATPSLPPTAEASVSTGGPGAPAQPVPVLTLEKLVEITATRFAGRQLRNRVWRAWRQDRAQQGALHAGQAQFRRALASRPPAILGLTWQAWRRSLLLRRSLAALADRRSARWASVVTLSRRARARQGALQSACFAGWVRFHRLCRAARRSEALHDRRVLAQAWAIWRGSRTNSEANRALRCALDGFAWRLRMRAAFRAWRRSVVGRRALAASSSALWQRRLLHRSLANWFRAVHHLRLLDESRLLTQHQVRLRCEGRVLGAWRAALDMRRRAAIFRLRRSRRQRGALFSAWHRALVAARGFEWGRRMHSQARLSKLFSSWRQLLHERQMVRAGRGRLLSFRAARILRGWRRWAIAQRASRLRLRRLRLRLAVLFLRRLLRGWFRYAQGRRSHRTTTRAARQLAARRICRAALRRWRGLAARRVDLRQRVEGMASRVRSAAAARVWASWKGALACARRRQAASRLLVHVDRLGLLGGDLRAWRRYTCGQAALRAARDSLHGRCRRALTRRCFDSWRGAVVAASRGHQAETRAALQERRWLLHVAWSHWRQFHSDEHRCARLAAECSRYAVARLWGRWRRALSHRRHFEVLVGRAASSQNGRHLRAAWLAWRRYVAAKQTRASKFRASRVFHNRRIASTFLRGWLLAVVGQVSRRQRLEAMLAARSNLCAREVVTVWRRLAQERALLRYRSDRWARLRQGELVLAVWRHWRRCSLERAALRSLQQAFNRLSLRYSLRRWHRAAHERRLLRQAESLFRQMHALPKAFLQWRLAARVHLWRRDAPRRLASRFLRGWHAAAGSASRRAAMIQTHRADRAALLLRRLLCAWSAWATRQRALRALARQMSLRCAQTRVSLLWAGWRSSFGLEKRVWGAWRLRLSVLAVRHARVAAWDAILRRGLLRRVWRAWGDFRMARRALVGWQQVASRQRRLLELLSARRFTLLRSLLTPWLAEARARRFNTSRWWARLKAGCQSAHHGRLLREAASRHARVLAMRRALVGWWRHAQATHRSRHITKILAASQRRRLLSASLRRWLEWRQRRHQRRLVSAARIEVCQQQRARTWVRFLLRRWHLIAKECVALRTLAARWAVKSSRSAVRRLWGVWRQAHKHALENARQQADMHAALWARPPSPPPMHPATLPLQRSLRRTSPRSASSDGESQKPNRSGSPIPRAPPKATPSGCTRRQAPTSEPCTPLSASMSPGFSRYAALLAQRYGMPDLASHIASGDLPSREEPDHTPHHADKRRATQYAALCAESLQTIDVASIHSKMIR